MAAAPAAEDERRRKTATDDDEGVVAAGKQSTPGLGSEAAAPMAAWRAAIRARRRRLPRRTSVGARPRTTTTTTTRALSPTRLRCNAGRSLLRRPAFLARGVPRTTDDGDNKEGAAAAGGDEGRSEAESSDEGEGDGGTTIGVWPFDIHEDEGEAAVVRDGDGVDDEIVGEENIKLAARLSAFDPFLFLVDDGGAVGDERGATAAAVGG